jgi:hypothetical protein
MHSCCRQVSAFSYFIRINFISHVYRGSYTKLVCRWSWVGGHEVFSVVYCSAIFVRRRRMRHLSYRFRGDGRSGREERWRCFSISFNGRRDSAHKAVTDFLYMIVFISRKIRYAKYIQTKDESCLLDPRRFTKCWWGVSREKTVIASSSLVGTNFLQVASHFYSSCTYYSSSYHKYENGSCSFGLPTRIFPQAISPTHGVSSYLPQEQRWHKNGLKSYLKHF